MMAIAIKSPMNDSVIAESHPIVFHMLGILQTLSVPRRAHHPNCILYDA